MPFLPKHSSESVIHLLSQTKHEVTRNNLLILNISVCFLSHNKLSFLHSITRKYNFHIIVKSVETSLSKFFDILPKFRKIKTFGSALAHPAPRSVQRSDGARGKKTSLAPWCSNLRAFGSKCTVLKKVRATLLELSAPLSYLIGARVIAPPSPSISPYLHPQRQHYCFVRLSSRVQCRSTLWVLLAAI